MPHQDCEHPSVLKRMSRFTESWKPHEAPFKLDAATQTLLPEASAFFQEWCYFLPRDIDQVVSFIYHCFICFWFFIFNDCTYNSGESLEKVTKIVSVVSKETLFSLCTSDILFCKWTVVPGKACAIRCYPSVFFVCHLIALGVLSVCLTYVSDRIVHCIAYSHANGTNTINYTNLLHCYIMRIRDSFSRGNIWMILCFYSRMYS